MRILAVLMALSAALFAQETRDLISENYRIKPGDTLNIIVFPADELSGMNVVQKDGKIALKLVGETQAAGLTLNELKNKLTLEVSKYVSGPSVSVSLKELGKTKIYMMGQVKSPGSYEYREGMKLLEIFSISGGYTNDADITMVKIFRGKDSRDVLTVNFEDVLTKGEMKKNISLQSEDIVYVPPKGISAFNWFLNNVMPALYLVSTVLTIYLVVR